MTTEPHRQFRVRARRDPTGIPRTTRLPKSREAWVLTGAAILVLLSRLPFLSCGYGDSDAWRVANAAREIAATSEYCVSRFPGHPVQEFAYSSMAEAGPFAFNVVTALFSTAAFVIFARSLRLLGCNYRILCSLSMVFTPVVYLASTCSLDCVWALALLLASFHFALLGRPVLAGVFLGLSIGCRVTQVTFILPLGLLFGFQAGQVPVLGLFQFAGTACLVSGATFLPVVLRYGTEILTAWDTHPGLGDVLFRGTFGVWGVPGTIAIAFVLVAVRWRDRRVQSPQDVVTTACSVAVALQLALFLWLPSKSVYLVQMVPFALLWFQQRLAHPSVLILCLGLLISPFLLTIEGGQLYIKGPLLRDQQLRTQALNLLGQVLVWAKNSEPRTVIVAGWYLPMLEYLNRPPLPNVTFVYLLDSRQLSQHEAQADPVYFLPGQRRYNLNLLDVDLVKYGGLPLATAEW